MTELTNSLPLISLASLTLMYVILFFSKAVTLALYNNKFANLTFAGHTHSVETCCFSPDSKYFCSGSWDTSAVVWNLKVHSFNYYFSLSFKTRFIG